MKPHTITLKHIIQNVCLSIGSIIVLLVIFEIYLRLTGYYPRKASITPPYLFTNHSTTWWTLRPNYNRNVRTPDGIVTYAINSQGIRAPHDISQENVSPLLFIIGDSFTFGVGVNESSTFPRVLDTIFIQQTIDMEIVNLGVAGFGTFHNYERLREYAKLLGTPKIVIYMFCPNDPVDNIAGRKEVVAGIRIDSHRKHKWLLAVIGHSYHTFRSFAFLLDRLYDRWFNPRTQRKRTLQEQTIDLANREDFRNTVAYLSQLIDWTTQHHVSLLVISTSPSQYSGPLKTFLEKREVPMLEAPDIFVRLNTENHPVHLLEGHWNQYGHQLLAQGIADYVLQQTWIEDNSGNSEQ